MRMAQSNNIGENIGGKSGKYRNYRRVLAKYTGYIGGKYLISYHCSTHINYNTRPISLDTFFFILKRLGSSVAKSFLIGVCASNLQIITSATMSTL